MARRILYSKFLRGQVILSEDLDKIPGASDQPAKAVNAEAGSSFSIAALRDSRSPSVRLAEGTVSSDTSAPVDGKKKESKEEKAQRRAEKAAKKQRSLEKKASKQAKLDRREEKRKTQLAEGEDSPLLDGTIKKQKSRKSEGKERARNGDVIGQGEEGVEETDRKKRKRESRASSVEDGTSVADNDAAVKPKKKKKRKADGEV